MAAHDAHGPNVDGVSVRTRRPPIRGRDSELAALRQSLEDVREGQGGWVVVSGQPGAGKTRLLEELKSQANAIGVRYFYGRGESEGQMTPFAPLITGMASGGIRLLEDQSAEDLEYSVENRFWILQELQDGLDHSSMDGPMVIVIDDIQWADDATLLALKTLPIRLVASPILWVVAVRQSAIRSSRIASVFERYADFDARLLALESLSDEAVSTLIEDMVGAPPDAKMLKSVLQSEGLPLYVLELVAGLIDEGLVKVQNGVAHLAGSTVPQRFRESVRARANQLSPAGRKTLEGASVIGRTFALEILADLLDTTVQELSDPIREATEAGLLLEVEDDLQFSHELFREIISEGVPASVHRVLQRRAIDVQLERGGNVVEVAVALAASAEPGDKEAVLMLRSAARQLSSLTPSTSADLALKSLELSPQTSPERANLVTEAATYLWQAGQAIQARKLIDDELAKTTTTEEEALLRIGVATMANQFSFAEAVKQSQIALALPGLSEATRLKIESQLALNAHMTGDFQRNINRYTTSQQDLQTLASFTVSRAAGQFYGGQWTESFATMHEGLVMADRAGIRYSKFDTEAVFISFILVSAGDIIGALREADRGVQETTRLRQGSAMRLWVMTRSRVLLDAGRLADAAVEAHALLEMVDELGPGNFADITALYVLARVALFEGDDEGVRRYQQDAARMMRDESARVANQGSWVAALCESHFGNDEDAIRLALPVIDRLHLGAPYFQGSTDAADDVVFIRLALRTGHPKAAEAMVDFIENRLRNNPTFQILRATAAHGRALLTDDLTMMTKAVFLLESIDRPIVLGSALEDLARMTLRREPGDAIRLYRDARDLYVKAGAFREERRVRTKLEGLGESTGQRDDDSLDPTWASLSAAQRSVVELIVQGLTNRQVAERLFLSPHTVNAHLRFAFTKLSVHSRVELAGRYHQMIAQKDPKSA